MCKCRAVFPRVYLEQLNSKNKFNTKDRGAPKSAGREAFSTTVNPALPRPFSEEKRARK